MPKLVEFYEELQGRPGSRVALDMDSRNPNVSHTYISNIVNQLLEDAMKEELTEIVGKLSEMLDEMRQVKLHLASMSNASVADDDMEKG